MAELSQITGAPHGRRFPAGAEPVEGGISFRVWAPAQQNVSVELEDGRGFPLVRELDGYFSAVLPVEPGTRYWLRLGHEEQRFADPASRFQPLGLAGPSEIIDATGFEWTDAGWQGLSPEGQILYELHIGTFTPEGTWSAAIGRLPHLRDLGITAVELLPAAEFQGDFGWGYDGVLLYAPTRLYGRPDDMRRFIDAAHGHGLGVVLDAVYNHFGAGDEFAHFSPDYFRQGVDNEWGKALNFDARTARGARDYYVANAVYWIAEFHVDGLRIDAAHAMEDESEEHVIAELVRKARAAAGGRSLYFAAENEPQDANLARARERGGFGLDAVWNEDFHHSAMVAATARKEAYMHDHLGTAQELAASARYGFMFQGQRYDWQAKGRGSNAFDLRAMNFVNYLQNHDQVANTPGGHRFWQRTSPAQARAVTALFLLSPQTPLLFQGQEFAARTPFYYFLGVDGELARKITEGRLEFLQQFQSLRDEEARNRIAEPADEEAFYHSKLDWRDLERNGEVMRLHHDLIAIRKTDAAIGRQPSLRDGLFDAGILTPEALLMRYFADRPEDNRLLLVNLGHDLPVRSIPDPLSAPPPGLEWHQIWSSEDPVYGGYGRREVDLAERFTLPGEAAILFGLRPARPARPRDKAKERQWQLNIF